MYQWAVIGAGPAGIATVAKLLDQEIKGEEIVWIDPTFTVGDFGTLWRHVPSNTKVELFLKFLHASKSFNYHNCHEDFEINKIPQHQTCKLHYMVEPLQWITHHLRKIVKSKTDTVQKLVNVDGIFEIELQKEKIRAKNVVLAIGSEPRLLNYSVPYQIPLQDAMDLNRVLDHISPEDTIAVFGSSHSAILVLRNLVEHNVKKVINFYRSPLVYAVQQEDYILYDDTGLKGTTAIWARKHIDHKLPDNLHRYYSDTHHIDQYLPHCNKVIYAVGFERRVLPVIGNVADVEYAENSGIISRGLFGVGIAFPEAKINPLGIKEYRVGLWKFMEYLQQVIPVWVKYSV